jgi:hypothetical protein
MPNSAAAPAKVRSHRLSEVLQSWEEIAHYLQSAVRTAQRWEITDGLPIRHLTEHGRGPVFAFPDELNQWSQARLRRELD